MPRFLDTDPNLNCQDPRVDPVQCTRSEFQRNVSKYSSGFTQAQRIASSAGLFSIIVSAGRKNVFDAMWWQQFPPNIWRRHEGLAIAQYWKAGELSILERRFPTSPFQDCNRHLFQKLTWLRLMAAAEASSAELRREEERRRRPEVPFLNMVMTTKKFLGFYHCFWWDLD